MALSDFLAPSLQIGATILSGGSQIAKGNAYQAIAARKRALGEFQTQQLEQQAETSRGVGMRNAQDEALKARLVNSMALARAAASGAGASDPTVVNILAQTEAESAYRQALAMYEGESQARLQRMQAAATRFEEETLRSDAAAAKKQANFNALTTVLSGALKASMYDKYWSGQDIGKEI